MPARKIVRVLREGEAVQVKFYGHERPDLLTQEVNNDLKLMEERGLVVKGLRYAVSPGPFHGAMVIYMKGGRENEHRAR